MTAVAATRDGTGWVLQLDAGHQSTRRTSLVHAEKLARDLVGDTEVVLCPLLPEGIDALLRASDVASAAAEDLQLRAYDMRLGIVRRLRGLGIGFADIGELLGIHPHRVRLLLD